MSLGGPRKAAMLLMHLDPPTAATLLESARPDTLTEIAAEVTFLEQNKPPVVAEPLREFFDVLNRPEEDVQEGAFAKAMLETLLGQEESKEILRRAGERVLDRDPFREIRSAPAAAISEALAGESAQVASVVLLELSPAKGTELLGLLSEDIRAGAMQCMAGGKAVSPEARRHVAAGIRSRLTPEAESETPSSDVPEEQNVQQRRAAILLRGLEVDVREGLLKSMAEQDAEAEQAVRDLMVTWEDILLVAERSLQEALRSVDSRKLALALVDAAERTTERIRGNISERAKAMLEEETSLLSSPKPDDITEAREAILRSLREMNTNGELQFEEGQL
jgi:flagellar motor switch protein FliG